MKYRKVLRLLVMIPPRINEIVAIYVVNDAPFSYIAYLFIYIFEKIKFNQIKVHLSNDKRRRVWVAYWDESWRS